MLFGISYVLVKLESHLTNNTEDNSNLIETFVVTQ